MSRLKDEALLGTVAIKLLLQVDTCVNSLQTCWMHAAELPTHHPQPIPFSDDLQTANESIVTLATLRTHPSSMSQLPKRLHNCGFWSYCNVDIPFHVKLRADLRIDKHCSVYELI